MHFRDDFDRGVLGSLYEYGCQQSFLDWVRNYRHLDLDKEQDELKMCPLIWCRKSLNSKESAVRHAVHCPLLSTAWYWCSHHRRPERFLECTQLCENDQKPIPRNKDSIPDLAGRFFKWIWRRQSEKRPGVCSTFPPLKYAKTNNLMLPRHSRGGNPRSERLCSGAGSST